MKKIVLAISALLLTFSCAKKNMDTLESVEVEKYGLTEQYKIYEVLATDTIVSVAQKTGVDAEIIIRYNSLKKPYLLKPGEMLKIPNIQTQEEDLIDAVDSLEDIRKTSSRHIQISPRR